MNGIAIITFGLLVVVIVGGCSLAAAWGVIRRLERELAGESKERRELGYRLQEREWEANRCYELLGLKRTPKRDAEWVKA